MNISSENYGQMLSIIYESIGQGEQIANNKVKDSFCKIKDEFNQFRIGADKLLGENKVLKIGVVGQVKAGKSSFLNSLFFDGENVLPRASTPMTAGLTVLEYGEENMFSIDYYNEKEWNTFEGKAKLYDDFLQEQKGMLSEGYNLSDEEIARMANISEDLTSAKELVSSCSGTARSKIKAQSFVETKTFSDISDLQDILADYVGAEGRYTSVVKSLTIKLNDERLKNLRIVDTPGVNDPIQSREFRTREFLRECHGVFLLSYAGRFFDSTDVNFLSGRIGSQGIGTVVLIASKFDSVLQDVGTKFPDDLVGAWEDCERQLKKQFRRNLAESDYKGDEPRFDVSSGIGYSIYNKPRDKWDSMEEHVVKQMKQFYPSNFDTIENIKETFFNLANIDVIRDNYLDGLFVKNRDRIMQSKLDGYFANVKKNITNIIDDQRSALEKHYQFVNNNDISEMRKIGDSTRRIIKVIKAEINTLANVCDDNAEKMRKRTWNSVPSLWNGSLPTVEECVTAYRKSTFWGSNKTFSVSFRRIDPQKMIRTLHENFMKAADKMTSSWEKESEELLKLINGKINDIITAAERQDTEAHIDADSIRHILTEVIAKMDNVRTLDLKNIINKAIEQVVDVSQDCDISTHVGSMDNNEASEKLKIRANDKRQEITDKVKRICNSLQSELETKLDESKVAVVSVFTNRKEELVSKASSEVDKYLVQLENDIKNKESELALYGEAIKQLDIIKSKL